MRTREKSGEGLLSTLFEHPLLYTFLSIIGGFLIGSIILLISGINPIEAYAYLWQGVFGDPKSVAWSVVNATPLILTGLSVAFAFKTGLFNIGAEGQYIVGALSAMLVGIAFEGPPVLHALLCLLAGLISGALWGSFAGLLKAYRGISEVITCIMTNWIAYHLNNYVTMSPGIRLEGAETSRHVAESARITILSLRQTFGPLTKINWGIFLAILMTALIWYILKHTTLGFSLRAVGFNRFGALYGGINVPKSLLTSMAISGSLAGLAGAIQVTGVQYFTTQLAAMENFGFNGLSVSFIGNNSPVGVFFAGLFYGGLRYGGAKLTQVNAPTELIDIVIGVIIYFIAISNALRLIVTYLRKKGQRL